MLAQESGKFLTTFTDVTVMLMQHSIGQQFAITEASYTTIKLLKAYKKIEPREFTPMAESLNLTFSVKGGVKVGLTPA